MWSSVSCTKLVLAFLEARTTSFASLGAETVFVPFVLCRWNFHYSSDTVIHHWKKLHGLFRRTGKPRCRHESYRWESNGDFRRGSSTSNSILFSAYRYSCRRTLSLISGFLQAVCKLHDHPGNNITSPTTNPFIKERAKPIESQREGSSPWIILCV